MTTCFVIMGYGEKTDFQANPQRLLNLDRTYQDVIKPAVEECNIACVRADEIVHSTLIDKPMYEQLLRADLVVADLSTTNANALYELGVRHALRPKSTIVMAERGFAFPFDVSHLSILRYEHLGKEIGFQEVMATRRRLVERIKAAVRDAEIDSPVHLFLPELSSAGSGRAPAPSEERADDKSFAELMGVFRSEKKAVENGGDWGVVISILKRLQKLQPQDTYLIQQRALATYKSKSPDALQALKSAQAVLAPLLPETSCDAETVGLWGAIHKRLWEVAKLGEDLDRAIRAYARGYFIKNDYYNGINYAFLLNVRAAQTTGDDAVADRVVARRVRREVLVLCDEAWASGTLNEDDCFWVRATKVEAFLGLGKAHDGDALKKELEAGKPPTWMMDSLNEQLTKLAPLNP